MSAIPKTLIYVAQQLLMAKLVKDKAASTVKKNTLGLGLIALSVFFAGTGVVFLILAFHAWLLSQYTPDAAALLTALSVFILSFVLAGTAFFSFRTHRKKKVTTAVTGYADGLMKDLEGLLAHFGDDLDGPIRDNPKIAIAIAAIVGFFLAKRVL